MGSCTIKCVKSERKGFEGEEACRGADGTDYAYCALMISCAARRAAAREVVRREGAERPFAASAARLAIRDASHSPHVILTTSFSDGSATLHLLAQRAQFVENAKVGQGGKPFRLAPVKP